MGNTQTVYVSGEVDFRVLRLDFNQPWFRKTNLCLRYPQTVTIRPDNLVVNYNTPLKTQYFTISNDDCEAYCCDGMKLREQGFTRILLLESTYNYFTSYSMTKVIEAKVVPITQNYAMK